VNSPNKPKDVQLVQFGYYATVLDVPEYPVELRRIFEAVKLGMNFVGAPNDPLTLAICVHQKRGGGTQDGHVIVMKGNLTYHPRHDYMMVDLSVAMITLMPTDFQRIDKQPNCPPLVRIGVKRALGHGK
jgi:hypothetical protein